MGRGCDCGMAQVPQGGEGQTSSLSSAQASREHYRLHPCSGLSTVPEGQGVQQASPRAILWLLPFSWAHAQKGGDKLCCRGPCSPLSLTSIHDSHGLCWDMFKPRSAGFLLLFLMLCLWPPLTLRFAQRVGASHGNRPGAGSTAVG